MKKTKTVLVARSLILLAAMLFLICNNYSKCGFEYLHNGRTVFISYNIVLSRCNISFHRGAKRQRTHEIS